MQWLLAAIVWSRLAVWAGGAGLTDPTTGQACLPCNPHDVPPPRPGKTVTANNGVRWPTMCVPPTPRGEEEHVFTIGDWGGIGRGAKTFDNTAKKRPFVWGTDDVAQHLVANLMKQVAMTSKPKYILNVGDNFYPGGLESHCGDVDMCSYVQTGQWENAWENVYDGPLKNLEWWACFGNHDFGGFSFGRGWDQQMAFTWHHDRWLLPAMYWERKVVYCTFSVDYYFLDSNVYDTTDPRHDPGHNICSREHNSRSCGSVGGPKDALDCVEWFRGMFAQQIAWLEARLKKSTADWQVIITHFPPQYGASLWRELAQKYGIDLFITGHRHQQEVHYMESGRGWMSLDLGGAAWTVTGGGGGVTSEGNPLWESSYVQQYGFMDLTLTKDQIHIDMWSGVTRKMRRRVSVNKNLPVNERPRFANASAPEGTCKKYGCREFHDSSLPCQCTLDCTMRRNCCKDYYRLCLPHAAAPRRLRHSSDPGSTGGPPRFQERDLSNRERCSASRRRVSVMNRRTTTDAPAAEEVVALELEGMSPPAGVPMADFLPSDYLDMVSDLSGEDCFQHCGNRSGYCENFCGVGKACCNQGNFDTDRKECRTATVFVQTSKYECVGIKDVDGTLFMRDMGLWPPPPEPSGPEVPGPGSARLPDGGANAPAALPPLWAPSPAPEAGGNGGNRGAPTGPAGAEVDDSGGNRGAPTGPAGAEVDNSGGNRGAPTGPAGAEVNSRGGNRGAPTGPAGAEVESRGGNRGAPTGPAGAEVDESDRNRGAPVGPAGAELNRGAPAVRYGNEEEDAGAAQTPAEFRDGFEDEHIDTVHRMLRWWRSALILGAACVAAGAGLLLASRGCGKSKRMPLRRRRDVLLRSSSEDPGASEDDALE